MQTIPQIIPQITPMTNPLTYIDRRRLVFDNTLRNREGPDSGVHLAALRKTLRNTGRLDPILVWSEVDDDGTETGRLVVLDGYYRFGAYRAEQAAGTIKGYNIPVVMFSGDYTAADLAAIGSNSKDTLPLTPQERLNAAWRAVRVHREKISKAGLRNASGISERTIARMRQQLKKFDAVGEPPSGNWIIDRKFPEKNDYEAPTDEARRDMVRALSGALKEALRSVRTRDSFIIADAVQEAFGPRQFALIADYLLGDDEDSDRATGWMQPDEFDIPPEADEHVLRETCGY